MIQKTQMGLAFALAAYPEKTVTIVVPFPPGGSTDAIARVLSQKLQEKLGANFIIGKQAWRHRHHRRGFRQARAGRRQGQAAWRHPRRGERPGRQGQAAGPGLRDRDPHATAVLAPSRPPRSDDAGTFAEGTASIEDVGWQLFRLMLEVASGRQRTWAERWKLHNALVLFNPAPVP